MAEVDVSSYKLPQREGIIDKAKKFGDIEQQRLGIEKAKLDLVNQRYGILNKELSNMANTPGITADEVIKRGQDLVNLKIIPPDMYSQFVKQIPTDPTKIGDYLATTLKRTMSTQEAVNFQYGVPGTVTNNQQLQPVVTSPAFGVKKIGPSIQMQPGPTTETVDNNPTLPDGTPNPNFGARRLLGSQPAEQPQGSIGLPAAPQDRTPIVPNRVKSLPVGPVNDPRIQGESNNFGGRVVSATVEPDKPATFAERFPVASGPTTSLAPGVGEAQKGAAEVSGGNFARDLTASSNYPSEIFPLQQAITALEKLGTKGTGPGTETINNLKSFVLSNVPGIKETDFNNTVADFDKAKKYLTDFVNRSGLAAGTNDRLASAMAGNPSVGISNAAAVDVAKAALALRNMQQAQILQAQQSNVTPDKYSAWAANWNKNVDPRAFGVNLMSQDKLKKLVEGMTKSEKEKFERSLEIAFKSGVIKPPGQ